MKDEPFDPALKRLAAAVLLALSAEIALLYWLGKAVA